MRYAEKLRRFADYLDRHPALADRMDRKYNYPVNSCYASDWEDFQGLVSDLGGYEKDGYSGQLVARHYGKEPESGETMYYVSVSVADVCEAKPKVDENGQPVMKRKQKYVETDELEQVVEWVCPEVWSS